MAQATIEQLLQAAVQHHQAGQLVQAEVLYKQILTQQPNHAEALHLLGVIAHQVGRIDIAVELIGRAIAILPNYSEAHSNLGIALKDKGQLDESIASYRKAITLKPNNSDAQNNLGNVLKDKGELDEAIACYRKAIGMKPDSSGIQSNLICTLHFHPDYEPQSLYQEQLLWNQQHAEPLRKFIKPYTNDRSSDRRLRIGYVSPDFRDHSVGRFLLPLLTHHDKDKVEIFSYAQVTSPDAMTQQFRILSDHWHSLVGLWDEQAAELIRHHQIDILVDLAGHTAHNRLLVFARKPAPVQVTYLGYPDTTGLSTMDYRLTDAYSDPPGRTESYHSEQLFRLSPCAWCYQSNESPSLDERQEGPITFGCFNNLAKVTDPMLRLWCKIMHGVPESRLMLKSLGFCSESTRQRVRQFLGSEGIKSERLDLRGYEPDYGGHLGLYGRVDIALDTFPYHGTNTTCEALWMGVPVVSLAGETHVSRVGVSLLTNSGLPELVAYNAEEYVRIAIELAQDRPRLSELRATLRQRMQESPLMDAPQYARNIEAAYYQMWKQWCT